MIYMNLMPKKGRTDRRIPALIVLNVLCLMMLGLKGRVFVGSSGRKLTPMPMGIDEREAAIAVLDRLERDRPELTAPAESLKSKLADERFDCQMVIAPHPWMAEQQNKIAFSSAFLSADPISQELALSEALEPAPAMALRPAASHLAE